MTEIDLTALLNDLSILEQQLIKTSQNILQLKEANKQNSAPTVRPVILPCEGFRIEDGSETHIPEKEIENLIVIENSNQDTTWYFNYFLGKNHQNFIGQDDEKNPYALSILINPEEESGPSTVRAILWRKTGAEKISILTKKKDFSPNDALKYFNHAYSKWAKPKLIQDQNLIKELLHIEQQLNTVKYKFGVIYAKGGQVTDSEFLGNETGSDGFNEFLNILGDTIELKDWKGYRAGLDVTNGNTGTHSIYTEYLGHEIMFHVSTLLPFSTTNSQQLERKRHIGNDIVVIIYQEDDTTPFSPAFMRTHFNHIFVVVRQEIIKGVKHYRLTVCTKDSVCLYGPPLVTPLFRDSNLFRRFLLTKLINAEAAAYSAPAFGVKMARTLEGLLGLIQDTYLKPSDNSLKKTKSSLTVDESFNFGQSIKDQILQEREQIHLKISTHNDKKPRTWKSELFAKSVPFQVYCGECWGEKLLAGTSDGLYLISEEDSTQLWDEPNITQMYLNEDIGFLVVLVNKNGKGGLFIFQLADFGQGTTYKGSCKDFRSEKTKGAHMFCVSQLKNGDEKSLKLCVAIKTSLYLMDYQSSSSGGKKFKKTKEFILPDPCCVLSFCDENTKICVGFKTEFNVIDIQTSQIVELFVAPNKFTPLACIPLKNDILLCYNHIGIFRSFDGQSTREYDLKWTTVPTKIAYLFPFVLAFGQNSIEIRTLINGKLIQTLPLHSIKFLVSQEYVYITSEGNTDEKVELNINRITFGDS